MTIVRWAISGELDLGHILAELGPSFRARKGPPSEVTVHYLDTFDWEAWRNGGRLTLEECPGSTRLRWRRTAPLPSFTVAVARPPRFAGELPPGVFRRELEAISGVRALLPVGAARVRRHPINVVSSQGKVVARISRNTMVVLSSDGATAGDPRDTVSLEGLAGFAKVEERLTALLDACPALSRTEPDDLAAAAAARGHRPGDYSSKLAFRLAPEAPAGEAVRTVLLHLLGTIEANVPGVLDDLDTEFLHDLRVATRRTRAAIGQLKRVFPPDELAPHAAELSWLGGVTGPCRDLDVFLLEVESYRSSLQPADATALGPLVALLDRERAGAHAELVAHLRSSRARAALDGWRSFLASAASEPPPTALRPIREVAFRRILRAYSRVVMAGLAAGERPSVEELHRLRIGAKKLRYLLEFFDSLLEPGRVAHLIAELKTLQDILGGYRDAFVQQQRLAELAAEMLRAGVDSPAPLLAVGRLVEVLAHRQADHLARYHDGFASFASAESQAEYNALFGTEGGS